MDKQYFDLAIGIGTDTQRRLLIAPAGTYLKVNETVETLRDTFCLIFVDSFCADDDRIFEAIKIALNQKEPDRIVRRIKSESVDWEVHSDDLDM